VFNRILRISYHTNFDIPTSENCDCEVYAPTSSFGNPEPCRSCSFYFDSADGGWNITHDCSNLLSGDCVGRDASNNCISRLRFETTGELQRAVAAYLLDSSSSTEAARTYGWPIGIWDVSKIQDFSYLFSVYDEDYAFADYYEAYGIYGGVVPG
jgi:hypothetical protein